MKFIGPLKSVRAGFNCSLFCNPIEKWAFLQKRGSIWPALSPKRLEIQTWGWSTMKENSEIFWIRYKRVRLFFYTLLCWSVPRSVGLSVTFYVFCFFLQFWPNCSCPNDLVTSITAPSLLHATGIAVYPALFFIRVVHHDSRGRRLANLSFSLC